MTPLEPPPGRRRERVIGAVVALVGVAVLVLSIIALADAGSQGGRSSTNAVTLPSGHTAGSGTSTPTAGPSATASSAAPSSTPTSTSSSTSSSASSGATSSTRMPLVVLNNTTRAGLAQQAATTFTRGGWTVTSTGNLSQDVLSTCAYYDPTVPGAQQAAAALMAQFPAIKRTKEKFGGLPAGPIVVVLTSDYTA